MNEIPSPTPAELSVLRVLWKRGPATVRQVYSSLRDERYTGYSTTLKIMQIMHEKGLLRRDEAVRPQVYRPTQAQSRTQLQLVDDLVQRAFGGSAAQLVLRATTAKRITPNELEEIKKLLGKSKQK